MIVKFLATFILVSLIIYSYQNIQHRIMALKDDLNLALTKVNDMEKASKDVADNTKKGLGDISQKIQNGKSEAIKALTNNLNIDEISKTNVLGIKTPQTIEINNLKIDYSQREIKVALNPLELENISSLQESFVIKVFVTDLKSDKSLIEDKYITISTEIDSNKGHFNIEEGNPLVIYYNGSKQNKLNSLTINPVLKITLPPGVYKGKYAGRLFVENY